MKILRFSKLAPEVTVADIKSVFERSGDIDDVILEFNANIINPESIGKGYIVFKDESNVDKCMDRYNGVDVAGSNIQLSIDNI